MTLMVGTAATLVTAPRPLPSALTLRNLARRLESQGRRRSAVQDRLLWAGTALVFLVTLLTLYTI